MIGALISLAHLGGGLLGFWWLRRVARSDRPGRSVTVAAFAASAAMAGFVFAATPVAPDLSALLDPILFPDFETAYWSAGRALLDGPENLRQEFTQGVNGFVSLPITAYAFLPFGAIASWRIAALLFAAVGAAAVLLSWKMVCDRFAFDREERAVALFALACFGPLLYSLREGNISHILLPALVWGICLLDARKDWQAGLVFGLLAVFKPLLFLVVVYLAARARFAAAFAGTATCIAFVGLSVLVFGWDTHLAWYGEAIAPYSKNPIAGFNAQSIASFIARFETGIPGYADWAPHALAPGAAMAVRALSIAVVAACLWAALSGGWRARPDTSETECEIHMTVLTACLISTLSWSHYYVWLLPAFAFLYVFGRRGAISPAWGWAAAGAYVLTAPIEYLSDHAGGSAILSNLIVSGRMFGGVALLAVLLRLRVQLQPRRLSGIAPVARHEA